MLERSDADKCLDWGDNVGGFVRCEVRSLTIGKLESERVNWQPVDDPRCFCQSVSAVF